MKWLKWLLVIACISILIVISAVTNFQFGDLEFQLHDTYFVVEGFEIAAVLAMLLVIVCLIWRKKRM